MKRNGDDNKIPDKNRINTNVNHNLQRIQKIEEVINLITVVAYETSAFQ